ncbi:MAG TPA: hypothetical protein P5142_05035 [Spirochaetia bacterium]|nr:hypothetical protein [Spirochaetia bacterium]
MKIPPLPAALLALAALAPRPCPAQGQPGYEELLGSALARDPALEALRVEAERAAIALARARLTRDSPVLEAGTGSASAALSDEGTELYAAPGASLTLPGGARIGASSVLGRGPSGSYASPSLSLGLPILRGRDDEGVAVERAAAAELAARASLSRRRFELEKELLAALKASFAADVGLAAARGAEARARRELDKARTIDGAEPGGLAYRRLERELRSKARASRDAEDALEEALETLAELAGPLPEGPPGEALPLPSAEPDLGAALPAAESSPEVAVAREAARAAAFEAAEAKKRVSLSAELGASYSTSSYLDSDEDSVLKGSSISGGLKASFEGLELSLGAARDPDAPSLGLSLAWKPAPRGARALRDRDEALAARQEAAKVDEALRAARKALARLEAERGRLLAGAEDAAWELGFARDQAAAYSGWRDRGMASDEEYAEVLAALRECESRSRAAFLDRAIWALELRALAGLPGSGGGL